MISMKSDSYKRPRAYRRARKSAGDAALLAQIGEHRDPPYATFPWFFVCQDRTQPARTFRVCIYAGTMLQARELLTAFLIDRPCNAYAVSIGECKDVPLTHVINAPNGENNHLCNHLA